MDFCGEGLVGREGVFGDPLLKNGGSYPVGVGSSWSTIWRGKMREDDGKKGS